MINEYNYDKLLSKNAIFDFVPSLNVSHIKQKHNSWSELDYLVVNISWYLAIYSCCYKATTNVD